MEPFESADAILDFDIAREQESYDFYTDLAGEMQNTGSGSTAIFLKKSWRCRASVSLPDIGAGGGETQAPL